MRVNKICKYATEVTIAFAMAAYTAALVGLFAGISVAIFHFLWSLPQ